MARNATVTPLLPLRVLPNVLVAGLRLPPEPRRVSVVCAVPSEGLHPLVLHDLLLLLLLRPTAPPAPAHRGLLVRIVDHHAGPVPPRVTPAPPILLVLVLVFVIILDRRGLLLSIPLGLLVQVGLLLLLLFLLVRFHDRRLSRPPRPEAVPLVVATLVLVDVVGDILEGRCRERGTPSATPLDLGVLIGLLAHALFEVFLVLWPGVSFVRAKSEFSQKTQPLSRIPRIHLTLTTGSTLILISFAWSRPPRARSAAPAYALTPAQPDSQPPTPSLL